MRLKKPSFKHKHFRRASGLGFTLAETLITVAVLTLLVTMIFPDVVSFFKLYRERQEELVLSKVREALELYARNNGTLPPQNTWAQDISRYTDIPVAQIRRDLWDNDRQYKMFERDDNYVEFGNVPVAYGVVFSYGGDRLIDASTTLDGLEPADPDDALDDFSNNDNTALATYQAIDIDQDQGGDDQLVKMDTAAIMIDAYRETARRMNKVKSTLDVYARQRINAAGGVDATVEIFYPRSQAAGAAGLYDPLVEAETAAYSGGTFRNAGPMDDAARRTDMQNLMRLLGLPLNYCCNAVNGGALYYCSNPETRAAPPYLPPTVQFDVAGC